MERSHGMTTEKLLTQKYAQLPGHQFNGAENGRERCERPEEQALPIASLNEDELLKDRLLDTAIEMTFPASDPVAIPHGAVKTGICPEMIPACVDHQNSKLMTESIGGTGNVQECASKAAVAGKVKH